MSLEELFGEQLSEVIKEVETEIRPMHQKIHETALFHQNKVLTSYRTHHVSEQHLHGTNGYGYNDVGRDTLDEIFADVFGAEAGLVRSQIISGTHAITTSLFGVLRPGDDLLYVTGEPYDTLLEVVGMTGNGVGSLQEYNIGYQCVPLTEEGRVDFEAVEEKMTAKTKMVAIQRSRGYSSRKSFTIDQIEEMITKIKAIKSDVVVFVDNCYGEFVEEKEPTEVGADLMAGSLIKNAGGGIAQNGGYIVGREDLVEACAYRLTSPGVGREAGATLNTLREMYQGFFLAPHMVGEAMKGAVFAAALLERMDVDVSPTWNEKRTDLIQSVSLGNQEDMVRFVQTVQKYSPVDAHVMPIPSYMPGYEDDVIMAAGAFVQGATSELSADGPIRPPYTLFLQGGLTYEHIKLAVGFAVKELYYQ